ncbi:MAG: hypothetical protein IH984_07835 [Planctomycetes bacterium]|nr:hypothetical protein [Planctomycetota bacterium]
MRLQKLLFSKCIGLVLGISLFMADPVKAHVVLDAPNGGQQLEVGSVYTIQWHIMISHNLLNWDVAYSVTGVGGPWIAIATNLPPGSGAVGSIHTYNWTIPDAVSNQVRVRVIMDNSGKDYQDISNSNLSIIPAPVAGDVNGDGIVNTTDLLILLGNWGKCTSCNVCPADLDGNCTVNTSDLLLLLGNWG